MHKFYTLEDLTQEKLNKLSLERNTLDSNWNELKKWLEDNVKNVEWTSLSEDYLTGLEDTLKKMQELEGNNE